MKWCVLTLISASFFLVLTTGAGATDDDPNRPASTPAASPAISTAPGGNAPAGMRAPGSLTTLFASNNGQDGNMFDLLPAIDLNIQAFDINVDNAGSTVSLDVYFKAGTCVGFEQNPSAWTLHGTFTGTSAGQDQPTFIDMASNPLTINSNQTYGIYVDTVTGGMNYTNGGPTTYSNSELSLTTHCGIASPFGMTFIPRLWNGTVYYDQAGPQIPFVDVKCNGANANVLVQMGSNAKIEFEVWAGSGTGTPIDLWFVMKTPFGFFSYNGLGPVSGWTAGLNNAYFTGPLTSATGIILDRPLPLGAYVTHGAIDTVPNGSLDMGSIFTKDKVDITVY